jgi:hypothetical protein
LKISHSHSTRAIFEMPHKFQKKKKKKLEIFTTSTYAILASTLKISAQKIIFFYPISEVSKTADMVY